MISVMFSCHILFTIYSKRRGTLRGVTVSQSSILEVTLTEKRRFVAERFRQPPYCSDTVAGSNPSSDVS